MALAVIAFGGAGAQGLPATPPTSPAVTAAPTEIQTPARQSPERAQVQLDGRMLTVSANNSSLNQILREISRVTGMKITGGVTDERVYGSYGPAEASTVLTALLGGTGSNVLIVLDDRQSPQELVLTPRAGGATPPNPNASRDRGEEDLPPQRTPRYPRQDGQGVTFPPNQVAPPPMPFPQGQQNAAPQNFQPQPIVAPPSDTTTQESPNGVKTPQQIYDQLMKMQQQQQQKPPG